MNGEMREAHDVARSFEYALMKDGDEEERR